MATVRLEQFGSIKLKGPDLYKHTGGKACARAEFSTGRRQASVPEIFKHVLNSKHMSTLIDFSLCIPVQTIKHMYKILQDCVYWHAKSYPGRRCSSKVLLAALSQKEWGTVTATSPSGELLWSLNSIKIHSRNPERKNKICPKNLKLLQQTFLICLLYFYFIQSNTHNKPPSNWKNSETLWIGQNESNLSYWLTQLITESQRCHQYFLSKSRNTPMIGHRYLFWLTTGRAIFTHTHALLQFSTLYQGSCNTCNINLLSWLISIPSVSTYFY